VKARAALKEEGFGVISMIPFTAAVIGGCFGQVANTWTFFLEFNCTASTPHTH